MYKLIGRENMLYSSKEKTLLKSENLSDIINKIYEQNENFTIAINTTYHEYIIEMTDINLINKSIKFAHVEVE